MSNPFEKYDIDPLEGPEGITARMRELAAEADEAQRDELRAVWEHLTLHPQDRLEAALEAFPETRPKIAGAPNPVAAAAQSAEDLALSDVALLPSVAAVLGQDDSALSLLPPLSHDPNLDEPT